MTIVCAKAFDAWIVTVSDTAITDGSARKVRNHIPGALKTIIISDNVTISYAGMACPGLFAVQESKSALDLRGRIDDVVGVLRRTSSEYDVDFLMSSHEPHPVLRKISGGAIACGASEYWIGDQGAANRMALLYHESRKLSESAFANTADSEIYILQGAMNGAITKFVMEESTSSVGGVPVASLASPDGHCYLSTAASFAWDEIKIRSAYDPPETVAEQEMRNALYRTGEKAFMYNTCAPQTRGVGVFGLYLPQARLGLVYEPLAQQKPDEFRAVTDIDGIEFCKGIERIAVSSKCAGP